ncbi:hypothetical protein CLM71_14455 [Serratia sp. MYb239]|uniref:HEAT repeat domain-containing protein n=1 Tax=Serratia sp. MYb239 TaxID=2033438 RepID=UPI000CF645C7|nr:HEAT repeat domain-containing protein [Serratia sp. MYb239]AVJ18252.1 hypothetical protein CLM71_14455 [Serratia sp. MYb239]
MSTDKKDLILSFIMNKITATELISSYNENYGEINICKELYNARNEKDPDAVDIFLYFGDVIGYRYTCINLLNNLLTETWHKKHEELVRLLAQYKSETSINSLFETSLLNLDYLDYDEDHVLADKCIRALAKINTKESIEKIKKLTHSDNASIRKSATKHLQKIKM